MTVEEKNIENGMGSNISSNQKPISSSLPGNQGTEKKEEIQSEGRKTESEGNSAYSECTTNGRTDQQQPGEPGCITEPTKLQHDGCGSIENGNTKFESDRQFWEFIERQQAAWDKYNSKRKSELMISPEIPIMIEMFVVNDNKKYNQEKRKRKNKKKWFTKKNRRNNKFHYIFI